MSEYPNGYAEAFRNLADVRARGFQERSEVDKRNRQIFYAMIDGVASATWRCTTGYVSNFMRKLRM